VGAPAHDARDREERREQLDRDAHRVVGAGGEEIDVGVEVTRLTVAAERVLHDRDVLVDWREQASIRKPEMLGRHFTAAAAPWPHSIMAFQVNLRPSRSVTLGAQLNSLRARVMSR